MRSLLSLVTAAAAPPFSIIPIFFIPIGAVTSFWVSHLHTRQVFPVKLYPTGQHFNKTRPLKFIRVLTFNCSFKSKLKSHHYPTVGEILSCQNYKFLTWKRHYTETTFHQLPFIPVLTPGLHLDSIHKHKSRNQNAPIVPSRGSRNIHA